MKRSLFALVACTILFSFSAKAQYGGLSVGYNMTLESYSVGYALRNEIGLVGFDASITTEHLSLAFNYTADLTQMDNFGIHAGGGLEGYMRHTNDDDISDYGYAWYGSLGYRFQKIYIEYSFGSLSYPLALPNNLEAYHRFKLTYLFGRGMY